VPSVRGELGFTQTYEDDYVGWPLAPRKQGHGVYGTFLNPTTVWPSGMPGANVGYHQAIDIPVNDAAGPQPVFSIEGGRVREARRAVQRTPLGVDVHCGVVGVGHFRYAHVRPSVAVGDVIAAGAEIGRTCPGWWHIHLEELAWVRGQKVLLNPLRPGGKLGPIADGGNPAIAAMRIYPKSAETDPSPRVLAANAIRGVVVPVALALDRFPLKSWPKAPVATLHVYRARIELRRDGALVLERPLFQLDRAPGPTWRHFFRPLTRRSAPVAVCVVRKPADCAGRFWLRLWENGWDTRTVPNGRYALRLTVEDAVGRSANRTLSFRIAN
jgi:hypothetical protein